MAGKKVDELVHHVKAQVRALEAMEKRLTKQGCLQAYAHFKTGTRKMFLLEPVDQDGKRPYTYVGVDPDKQREAVAKIARWRRREEMRRTLEGLRRELAALEYDLTAVERDAQRLRGDVDEAVEGFSAPVVVEVPEPAA